jgi:hypothetical protein
VSAGKQSRELWDSLSKLRSSLCEKQLKRAVLRPALLPVKISQFTQFFRQVSRRAVKSLSLTVKVYGALYTSLYIFNTNYCYNPGTVDLYVSIFCT